MIEEHAYKYAGKKALVVLGGPSGKNWKSIDHDVLIGVNGVNGKIKHLDYWLCTENMAYPSNRSLDGEQRYIDIMRMFQKTGAKYRLVNKKSYDFLKNKENVIQIQRCGVEAEDLHLYSFRRYQEGLINGSLLKHMEGMRGQVRVGTVGLQAIHLAGILGCDEVHTIGFDLFLPDKHHWYSYPIYEETRFFTPAMFTEYEGLKTLWFWVETAEYMKKAEDVMIRDGLKWVDHSHGLLKKKKLRATQQYRLCHQGEKMLGTKSYEEHRQLCEVCE